MIVTVQIEKDNLEMSNVVKKTTYSLNKILFKIILHDVLFAMEA